MKECTKCGQTKADSDFYRDSRTTTGRYSACKACHKQSNVDKPRECACGNTVSRNSRSGRCRRCAIAFRQMSLRSIDRHGYVYVWVDGVKQAEHRAVMEASLGRKLFPGENVHHRNGVRYDNRIENLELWVTYQPKGQRPEDLVEWAREVLNRYMES